MTDITLSFNETYGWIFSGLNVKIWQCNVDPIGIVVQSESLPNHTEQMVENPGIVIQNSSFGSLDLKPGSKAQISDCYIDAQFKPRPTLITANNSNVSIQNCHFGNSINENGSKVLHGHDNSHITIENSVFTQHNSSMGVLFLQRNSFMYINNLTYSDNVATTFGFSSIALEDRIHAVMNNTVFRNNSALGRGALITRGQCKVTLINCTFSSNKAKNFIRRRSTGTPDRNSIRTVTPMSPTLFNRTSTYGKKPKAIATNLLVRNPVLKKYSVEQVDPYPSSGGAIFLETQSELLVTNCIFKDNSAQVSAGAISATNVTLHLQETTFVGNKAQMKAGAIATWQNTALHVERTTFVGNKVLVGDGGAMYDLQSHIHMTNCTFEYNSAQGWAGAIIIGSQTTLRVQETTFVGNKAQLAAGAILAAFNATLYLEESTFVGNKVSVDGGAIHIQWAQLQMRACVFNNNIADHIGGAITAGSNATLQINATNFTGNITEQGGAIDVQFQTYLKMTNCVFDNNIAEGRGGAINEIFATVDIQETSFTRNRAGTQGGAINAQQAYLRTTNCTFEDNRAEILGGALAEGLEAVLEINGSYFSKNIARQGGAILAQRHTNLSLTNCRLERNFAIDSGGAIVSFTSSTLKIQETNFTGNGAFLMGEA